MNFKRSLWSNFFILSAGFAFTEIRSTRASTSKVICCHFSSDGKLLASGGHDKKVCCILKYINYDSRTTIVIL